MGESLNQPFRVKEEGLTGCKLLFHGNKILYEYEIEGTVGISIG